MIREKLLTRDEMEARRLHAAALLAAGWKTRDVKREFGISGKTVAKWKKTIQAKGAAGLAKRKAPGRHPDLTQSQRDELVGIWNRGPRAAGVEHDKWTCWALRDVILDRYGVLYHTDHVSRLIRQLGLRPQKQDTQFRRYGGGIS